jgi:hypothetical protein
MQTLTGQLDAHKVKTEEPDQQIISLKRRVGLVEGGSHA